MGAVRGAGSLHLTGSATVIRNITVLNYKMQISAKEAVRAAGFMAQRDARTLVPVDTGRLRASLTVNWTGSGLGRARARGAASKVDDGIGEPQSGMSQTGKSLKYVSIVGTNVEYAEAVEKNNSPYLWPAIIMNRQKFLSTMGLILGRSFI